MKQGYRALRMEEREDKDMSRGRIALMVLATVCLLTVPAVVYAGGGFDEFGYNYQARLFVGPADGVDQVLDGTVWGDPAYANDHLVMKWSKAWDDARFNAAPWTSDAWENNEWNGAFPDGSGEVWHYKIQWVGDCTDGEYFDDGGYCIWGQFEVIMDQGTADGEHIWFAHAIPNGYGGPP